MKWAAHPARHVDGDLKAYTDGELGTARRLMVKRHLAVCESCREKEQEMKRITEQLTGWGGAKNAALSPDLRAHLLAQAPAGRASDALVYKPLWRRSPGLVFGGGGLSLAASLAAFAVLYNTANHNAVQGQETVAVAAASAPGTVEVGKTAEAVSVEDAVRAERPESNAQDAAAAPARSTSAVRNSPFAGEVAAASQTVTNRPLGSSRSQTFQVRNEGNINAAALLDQRQVHREASLSVAVDNPEATSGKIETLVKEWGGYVASNVLTTDAGGYKAADLTLKVPEERFDEMLASLSKMGDVRSKNITGEDITEQTSDATSDEQVLITEADRLAARLKAENLSERRTLQTETQLRQVQQELARTRARLGLLRKLARLSTLNVTLTERKTIETGPAPTSGFWYEMRDSNRAALKAFQAAIRVPLLLAIWAVALSPLWLPLLLVYRHFARNNQVVTGPVDAAIPLETASLDR